LAGKTATGGRLDLSEVIAPATTVAGRYLFYNSSSWDGNNAAANANDDAAIAPGKVPLLPGGTATIANYNSYSRGVNGIMIDIVGLGNPGALSASDFTFKVGNDNNPGAWGNAPAPTTVAVRVGAGTGGSDRVTVTWANNAIQKQWLQVTVLASANTGLLIPDVFYFGNAIGETGNSAANAQVTSADVLRARANPRNALNPALLDDPHDFNRDKLVNAQDQLIARANQAGALIALRLITVP
jgi:hypothetical protein